jgi:hypothetical protein
MSFVDFLGRELETGMIVAFIAYNVSNCSSPTIKVGKVIELKTKRKSYYGKSVEIPSIFCLSISLKENEEQITQWVQADNTLILDDDMLGQLTLAKLTVSEVGKQVNLELVPNEKIAMLRKAAKERGYFFTYAKKDYKQTVTVSLPNKAGKYVSSVAKEYLAMQTFIENLLKHHNIAFEVGYCNYGQKYILNP